MNDARERFRQLHQSGCFVIPNPWDIGSARFLEHLGFPALATTSAGFAFSQGLPDAAVPVELMLRHVEEIVAATALPVNADFESGYAADAAGVAKNVRLCVETGVAGLSIEDASGNSEHPLYDLPEAIERIRAAREAIDASGTGVLLTARAEVHLLAYPEAMKEGVRRVAAYAEAGADVLYAPGVQRRADIEAIVAAASPKPVNILMSTNIGLKVDDLARMGVRRISVGSGLARAAWAGFLRAARELASNGSFSGFDGAAPFAELNDFFTARQNHT